MYDLFMYDLSDDAHRLRVAKYLEGKGHRIQESVFECTLSAEEAARTAEDLAKLTDGSSGTIRIYPVCAVCYSKTIGIGDIRDDTEKKGFIVF